MPFHKGILPREGFYADVVYRLLDRTVLNPNLLLPLVLLARYTKRGEDLSILHPKAFSRLKRLFYFSLLRAAVRWLSDKQRNHWSNDRYDWSREIVVITGGSSGIGAQMVKFFDEQGIKVVIIDVNPPSFHTTSSRVRHYLCDIRSYEAVTETAAKIRSDVGSPTVLINNAGIFHGKSILDAEKKDIELTFAVNTLSHYWLTKAFLPDMITRNHGMVVTVASLAAHITTPNMVDYAASKAAALAFHEGLTAEIRTNYKATKIRTVIVQPGHIKTPLFEGFSTNTPWSMPSLHPDTVAESVVKQVLTGRSGNVILPLAGNAVPIIRVVSDFDSIRRRTQGSVYTKNWSAQNYVKGREDAMNKKSDADPSESGILLVDEEK